MRKNSGFTLFELLVVIAIISILSSFTIIKVIGWLPKYKLGSAVRTMHSTFQLARVAAVNKNSIVSMVFSPGTDSCLAFVDNGDGTGGIPDNGNLDGTEKLIKKMDLPPGIDLKDPTFGLVLKFDNRGMPDAGGDVVIENTAKSKTVRLFLSGKSSIL